MRDNTVMPDITVMADVESVRPPASGLPMVYTARDERASTPEAAMKVFVFDLVPYAEHLDHLKESKELPWPLPRRHFKPDVAVRTYAEHLAAWEAMDRLARTTTCGRSICPLSPARASAIVT